MKILLKSILLIFSIVVVIFGLLLLVRQIPGYCLLPDYMHSIIAALLGIIGGQLVIRSDRWLKRK